MIEHGSCQAAPASGAKHSTWDTCSRCGGSQTASEPSARPHLSERRIPQQPLARVVHWRLVQRRQRDAVIQTCSKRTSTFELMRNVGQLAEAVMKA